MVPLVWIVLSTFLVSALSVVGVVTLFLKEKLLKKILLVLVAFSAGALMGGAFLDLIPEAIEKQPMYNPFLLVLGGFSAFFLLGKILHWHQHGHAQHRGLHQKQTVHAFVYLNLIGDGVHNFIDGVILAASYVTNIHLGIVTTIAIAAHEIPQELGDFGVLVYGGLNKWRALFLNFLSAVFAMVGGIVGYLLSTRLESFVAFLLPVAAGGFIYIAASDLIPELKKEIRLRSTLWNFGMFLVGILLIYITTRFFPGV